MHIEVFLLIFQFFVLLGKTTILKILGGKHMVEPEMVRVLGRSAFHDTGLTSSGDLCYLGGEVSDFVTLINALFKLLTNLGLISMWISLNCVIIICDRHLLLIS
jgi:hypothetical protein